MGYITDSQLGDLVTRITTKLNALNLAAAAAFRGGLAIADTPTGNGFWLPTESGTYTNAGGIVVDLTAGLTVLATADSGVTWTDVVVPISFTANPNVEEGSTDPVESGAVYDFVRPDFEKILLYPNHDISDITSGKFWNVSAGNIIQTTNASFTLFEKVIPLAGLKYVLFSGIPDTISTASIIGVVTNAGVNTTVSKSLTPSYSQVANNRLYEVKAGDTELRLHCATTDLPTAKVELLQYDPEEIVGEDISLNNLFTEELNTRLKVIRNDLGLLENLRINSYVKNLAEGIEIKRNTLYNGSYVVSQGKHCTDYIPTQGNRIIFFKDVSILANSGLAFACVDSSFTFINSKTKAQLTENNNGEYSILVPFNTAYVVLVSDVTVNYETFKNGVGVSYSTFIAPDTYKLSEDNLGNRLVTVPDIYETYEIKNVSLASGWYYIVSGSSLIYQPLASLVALSVNADIVGKKSVIIGGIPDTVATHTSSTFIARVILADDTFFNVRPTYDCTQIGLDAFRYNLPEGAQAIYIWVNNADAATVKLYVSNSDDVNVIDTGKGRKELFGTVKPFEGKILVGYGDSLTFRESWQPYLVDTLGFTYVNKGIGSTALGGADSNPGTIPTFWNATRLTGVKAENPDAITICGGANDHGYDVPIGTEADIVAKNTLTYIGAWAYIIDDLLTWKPTLRIMIWTSTANGSGVANANGDTGTDFNDADRLIAKRFRLSIADTALESGINNYNITQNTTDGVHYNDLGGKKIAQILIDAFEKIELSL